MKYINFRLDLVNSFEYVNKEISVLAKIILLPVKAIIVLFSWYMLMILGPEEDEEEA